MSKEQRLTFNLIESSRRKGKDGEARAYRNAWGQTPAMR